VSVVILATDVIAFAPTQSALSLQTIQFVFSLRSFVSTFVLVNPLTTSLITPAAQAAAPLVFVASFNNADNYFPLTTGVTSYVYVPQERTPLLTATLNNISYLVPYTEAHTRSTSLATEFLVVTVNVAV